MKVGERGFCAARVNRADTSGGRGRGGIPIVAAAYHLRPNDGGIQPSPPASPSSLLFRCTAKVSQQAGGFPFPAKPPPPLGPPTPSTPSPPPAQHRHAPILP